jgi:hypothetical protein
MMRNVLTALAALFGLVALVVITNVIHFWSG